MSADNKKVVSNENLAAFAEALAAKVPLKSDIPTKVSDLQNDLGFTDNPGTITSVTLNGTTTSSGGVDLGYLVVQEGGKGLSSNDYTALEKTKLGGIDTGAQVNTIETVKVNDTALVPDANKAVNVQVPTTVAELSDASDYATVSDLEDYVLVTDLEDTEEVFAAAVNDLNNRIDGLVDQYPTENSTNAVSSGGVYEAITENELVTAASLSSLNARVTDLENSAESAPGLDQVPTENSTNAVSSGGVYSIITQNELISAAAINDLNDKVSDVEDAVENIVIPTKVSDLQNDSGFTSNTGTLTGITMNGASKGTFGVVDLGTIVVSESDPVFSASPAANITSADITNWNSKTSNTGTLTGVTFNGNAATVTNGVASISASIPDVANYFDEVSYDSQTKRINFKHGNTIKKYIDATDFIKDGMVDSVEIATPESGTNAGVSCLVVTFNTDAGKEDIEIPLSSIFNPSNYYTKTEIEARDLWEPGTGTGSAILKGTRNIASGNYSVAEGRLTVASGDYSHAEGQTAMSSSDPFTVRELTSDEKSQSQSEFGSEFDYYASGDLTWIHEKDSNLSYGIYSDSGCTQQVGTIIGSDIQGTFDGEIMGQNGYTLFGFLFNLSTNTGLSADNTTLYYFKNILSSSEASGLASHAEGSGTASGDYSHAEGYGTTASGEYSHAEGENATASGRNAHAEGWYAIASGAGSHAEGSGEASGYHSHAEGGGTASGQDAHAEGYGRAVGERSHAEGENTQALGLKSHVEGTNTIAYEGAPTSHAEGYNSVTGGTATYNNLSAGSGSGYASAYAHAEGNATMSKGRGSHSEGEKTFAAGRASHAEGFYTNVQNLGEHAEGKYNHSIQNKTIHSTGIGDGNEHPEMNAFEIWNDGKAFLYNVYGYDGTNPSASTSLQEFLDITPFSSSEYNSLFLEDPDFNYIYFDDYPEKEEEHISGGIAEYAERSNISASSLVSDICQYIDDPSPTSNTLISGVNCYKYTGEVFEYNNTSYWLFQVYDPIEEDWINNSNVQYMLVETDKTLAGLTAQSLESNVNNTTIPYYALLSSDDNSVYRLGEDSDDILIAVR